MTNQPHSYIRLKQLRAKNAKKNNFIKFDLILKKETPIESKPR